MFQTKESVQIKFKTHDLNLGGTIREADQHHLLVACHTSNALEVEAGTQVELAQYNGDGSFYMMDTTVTCCRKTLLVVPIVLPRYTQRRRQPRLDCELSAWYNKRDGQESFADARVCDVSISGMRLAAQEPLTKGSIFDVEFELDIDGRMERIKSACEVMRCTALDLPLRTPAGPMTHELALRFNQIARLDQVRLMRYIQAGTA